jgi:hypothetical protein
MDLFSWRVHFEESESKEDVDQTEFLERQFDLLDAVPSCILVATNVSVIPLSLLPPSSIGFGA